MPWRIWYARIVQILWLFYEDSYMIRLEVPRRQALDTKTTAVKNHARLNASGCKNMDFKVTMDGKALVNHVFKTIPTATNEGNCQSMCFRDDRCISFNFGTSAVGEKYMCELSESDHVMHPEDLKDRPGTIYRRAENTCNCSKNSRCRFNFVDGTHRCECKPGFVGDSCRVYLPEDSSLSWVDAQNDCNKTRMALPSIHSDEENERIRKLIPPGQSNVWIGLMKKGGRWIWADGSDSEYRNWLWITYDYDCAVMYQNSGKWGKRDCSWSFRYFCIQSV